MGRRAEPTFSLAREAAIGLAVYAGYLLVRRRVLREGGRSRAERNARRLVTLERRLGLHLEPRLQALVLPRRRFVASLNVAYATLNVGMTVVWLAGLYRRRDRAFHRYRRAAVTAVVGAQPVFLLVPVAPPRTLEHLVDTIAEVGGVDLDSGLIEKLYNPIGALPSIHVAIAVVTAAGIRATSPRPWARAVAPVYPAAVAAVVFLTANHYVADALAGTALGRAALRLTR